MRGRTPQRVVTGSGASSPLSALVVRFDPLLRERVVTARFLQPSPPVVASLRVTLVNDLAIPDAIVRGRSQRQSLDGGGSRRRGRSRARRVLGEAAPFVAGAKRGREADAGFFSTSPPPRSRSRAPRSRSRFAHGGDDAPKRRRAESRPHAGGSALASEAFGPALPCPARVLAEAGVMLAAQHARRRVDFAAQGSSLANANTLLLRLTRYESAPARGDRVDALFGRASQQPWRGVVARRDGRQATVLADDSSHTAGAAAGATPESVTVVFSADRLAQSVRDCAERHADSGIAPGFATRHLQTKVATCAPARRPAIQDVDVDGLNDDQAALVRYVADGAPLTLALGPPGTGKTRTVAAVASALAASGETVLVLTQQNVAALNVLRALRAAGCEAAQLLVSASYYIDWHAHEYDAALWPWLHVPGAEDIGADAPPPSQAIAAPRILLCTFGMLPSLAMEGSRASALMHGDDVTAVCVDEAGAAWAGLSYALDAACPAVSRLHLFGDDRQLPPSLGGARDGGGAGPRVASLYDAARAAGHAAHALTTQYRLPHGLAAFLSRNMYDGTVASAPGAGAASGPGVRWIDVQDGQAAHRFGSYYNVQEVHAVVTVMDAIDAAHGGDGGARVVLTPYREQRDALEAAAGNRARAHGGAWDVKTVDAMQGREARHVVLSLVRVPHATGGGAGFLRDARRANVALSRCAGELAVVGHHAAWAAEGHPAELLRALACQTPPQPNNAAGTEQLACAMPQ